MNINPTVCVVRDSYYIMVVSDEEALISINIGNKNYYYHSNGIRVSSPGVHRFIIPQEVLNQEKQYTVIIEKMLERKAYFSEIGEKAQKTYKFKPIEKSDNINIYHLADVHGMEKRAIGAVKYIEKDLDLLIMNGDISSSSDTFEDIILTYKITSEITRGEIPCVISRGNHDMRGPNAENLSAYMPGDNGKSYYSFKIGCIWGLLVDCGEDKNDENDAYNKTICCHEFRLEQENAICQIIKNAKNEYDADGINYRFIISHIPFTFKVNPPFDIEKDLYKRWSELIRVNIKPHLMLCGHTHDACVSTSGSEYDELGHPCTVVVGSDLRKDEENKYVLSGAFLNIKKDRIDITFNNENNVIGQYTLEL